MLTSHSGGKKNKHQRSRFWGNATRWMWKWEHFGGQTLAILIQFSTFTETRLCRLCARKQANACCLIWFARRINMRWGLHTSLQMPGAGNVQTAHCFVLQVRRYGSVKWLTTETTGRIMETAVITTFLRLFLYINGTIERVFTWRLEHFYCFCFPVIPCLCHSRWKKKTLIFWFDWFRAPNPNISSRYCKNARQKEVFGKHRLPNEFPAAGGITE